MRNSYSLMPILLKLHMCFGHDLKTCIWFGYNPQIIFFTFPAISISSFFQALLLSTYVDSRYLVRVTHTIKLYIFRWFHISLKILGGEHKFSEFACCGTYSTLNKVSVSMWSTFYICFTLDNQMMV